jgi:hypothetical protein
MANPFNKLNPGSAGPPPFVVALLVVEIVVTTALFFTGVSLGELLASAGPAIALTLALLNPTVQELGRRQPKLSVLAEQANDDDVVTVSALRPWPVDIDRVVANEVAAARHTLTTRSNAMNTMVRLHDPFAVLPSDKDRHEARGAFEQELTDYEVNLRSWLTEYATAASVCSQTVALTLRLTNDRRGAHADAVTVVLDLPPTITTAEDRPSMALPPKRPCYEPPRPRSLRADQSGWSRTPLITSVRRADVPPIAFRRDAGWKITDDQRHLEATVGEAHSGRSVKLVEPPLLLVDGAGRHDIAWTAYTKSARRAAHGTLTLLVPASMERPAFGRLHGVTKYPDVPIIDDGGEIIHSIRATDPPLRPAAVEDVDGVVKGLREARALWEWNALGLDPSTDGPDRSVVVGEAEPVGAVVES